MNPNKTSRTALVGSSGFVGSNLLSQRSFSELYRSTNIDDIRGQHFDLVVCAGAPAEKWKANQNPEADRANINRLMECLSEVNAKRFVLISTVDVYKDPRGVNEDVAIVEEGLHPYGLHRRMLEKFVEEKFDFSILRLPGLFGNGLKKNVIYDFLNHNDVSKIDSRSVYQFYDLSSLSEDIERTLERDIKLLNVSTEPVAVHEIAQNCFGISFENHVSQTPAFYDFRSKHWSAWGGNNGYLYTKRDTLGRLTKFVASYAK
jgi:nucleoside-diphosphate-sugar epimerase